MTYVIFEKDFIDNITRIVEVVETEEKAMEIVANEKEKYEDWDFYYSPMSEEEARSLSSVLEEEF